MPNQTGTSSPVDASAPDHEDGSAIVEPNSAVQFVPGGGGARIAPVLAPSSRRRSSRRGAEGGGSRSQSKTKKIAQLRLMVTGLLTVLMVAVMVAIYYWAKADPLHAEVLSLTTDLSHIQKELDKARELLRAQDNEISAMMSRRIPGVAELTFDNLVNANDKYLRKITFSQSGVGPKKVVEFHAVLENKGSAPLLPDVRILLFDRMGLQSGSVKLGQQHAGGDATPAELRPEETRTYAGLVPAEREAEPKYFMIEVR